MDGYSITNIFCKCEEAERKEKINRIIRALCVMDIEKINNLNYNEDVTFRGGTPGPELEGVL